MARVLAFDDQNPSATTFDDSQIQAAYSEYEAWGMEVQLDIPACNPDTIRDADAIRTIVIDLCNLIKMKRYDDTVVVNFGEDERVAGFSMTQLIETSLISGHFANQTNAVYFNVFSCCPFNPWVVAKFLTEVFGGTTYSFVCSLRKA